MRNNSVSKGAKYFSTITSHYCIFHLKCFITCVNLFNYLMSSSAVVTVKVLNSYDLFPKCFTWNIVTIHSFCFHLNKILLSTQSSLIADFCIVYLWILTYCNYSVVTVPRGVLTWICQNPETYEPKCHHRRWFTRATSQSPCLHGTLRSAAITIKTRKAWFYRSNAFWLVTVKVLNSYDIFILKGLSQHYL